MQLLLTLLGKLVELIRMGILMLFSMMLTETRDDWSSPGLHRVRFETLETNREAPLDRPPRGGRGHRNQPQGPL